MIVLISRKSLVFLRLSSAISGCVRLSTWVGFCLLVCLFVCFLVVCLFVCLFVCFFCLFLFYMIDTTVVFLCRKHCLYASHTFYDCGRQKSLKI